MDPLKEILLQYGIKDDWEAILGLGVGNRIYATSDVILSIAADHPDSLSDAYHDKNILCSPKDYLLAIIDWGDAGWGDPVLDFASIPLEAVLLVMKGYEAEVPGMLGSQPVIRMVWDKLYLAMKKVLRHPGVSLPLDQLLYFLNDGISKR